MPIEPPPSGWVIPPPDDDSPDDLVAVGADLGAGTLLAAYRAGLFPMPVGPPRDRDAALGWWSPEHRGVLRPPDLRVSRSLRRAMRDRHVTVDTAFDDVLAACADPRRPGAWITPSVAAAYRELHRLGWAHSVETRTPEGRLVGGLYGLAIGGLFAGESMFHSSDADGRDASKIALVALVDLLRADGDPRRLVDVQWQTDHLATLGVTEVDRRTYRVLLADALAAPLPPALRGAVARG